MRRYNLYVNWYPRGDIEGAVNVDNLTYANYGSASVPIYKSVLVIYHLNYKI